MARKYFNVAGLLLVSLLAVYGGDVVMHTQTKETPQFVISVTVDPHPVRIGSKAKLYVTLRRDRSGVTGCRVRMQPTAQGQVAMPQGEWTELPEQGTSGIYSLRKDLFSAAGSWDIHFAVKCLGPEETITMGFSAVGT